MGWGRERGDAFVHQVASEWEEAPLEDVDRALCTWARQLTAAPGSVAPDNLRELRIKGLTDRAIHDATQVIAYFNYITRVADGLGVEPEVFIRRWGDAESDERPGRVP
ncbi:MAG: hypothetical protein OEO23_12190 [Gemmatimonadota bacterium]|nr:hypothetical protein [Gemmatimonadota bacterium]